MTQPAQSSDYCAKCHLMILQPNVNYGINPDAVCKCPSAPAQRAAQPQEVPAEQRDAKQMLTDLGNVIALLDAHQINIGETLEEDDNAVFQAIIERHKYWTAQPASAAKPAAEELKEQARKLAADWCYNVYAWRGRSPGFMQGQLTKLADSIAAFIRTYQAAREGLHEWISTDHVRLRGENMKLKARERELLERCEPAEGVAKKQSHSIAKLDNQLQALLKAVKQAESHVEELSEAWVSGALSEHDGWGGTRSNRNAELLVRLRALIAKQKEGK